MSVTINVYSVSINCSSILSCNTHIPRTCAEAAKEEEADDDMDGFPSDYEEDDADGSDKEMGDDAEDGDEASSTRLKKLAAQVFLNRITGLIIFLCIIVNISSIRIDVLKVLRSPINP